VPYSNLASEDGAVAGEFIWAALDCPTGFAGVGAQHLGMTGAETILFGRMSARIERRPYPGDRCIIVAWPTGRDGRKLFASSALLNSDGKFLAIAPGNLASGRATGSARRMIERFCGVRVFARCAGPSRIFYIRRPLVEKSQLT
jgi:hypothetical protein